MRKGKVSKMKKVLKSKLLTCILILVLASAIFVFAEDVIVKEGTLELEIVNAAATVEGQKFKSTGCTATGTKAVALGTLTEASGTYSTAMGYDTTASGSYSTAMGKWTNATGDYSTVMGTAGLASGFASTAMGFITAATGDCSTAMGYSITAGSATYTTAIGKNFNNNVQDSFAVGFGQKDFSVESELVTVHNDLYVTYDVDANTYSEHSAFYDKNTYGSALDYSQDSSNTIKVNAAGQGPCLVTLSSDFGKKYAQTTADFPTPLPDPPPPEYIPDFDGDGDVDFADFSYFSLHWLEQPDT
jgi:hypothetical protein